MLCRNQSTPSPEEDLQPRALERGAGWEQGWRSGESARLPPIIKDVKSYKGPLRDHNDIEVLDDGLKAKLFNQYFANIGKEIAESFPEENRSILRNIYRVTSPTCSTLDLEISNITKSLGKIKANKAAGLDNISSTIIPLSAQWGFAKGLSAEGVLLSLTNRWKMELDKGLTVGAIFVDFRKAFDSLSHNILSLKLQAVGICGNLHEWLMNYLSDWCQCTLVNGYISDLTLVQYGIPQGSLLGPRLYTIYVNDLPDAITLGNVLMCADDTTIYCIGKSFDEVCLNLNKVLDD
ncbi:RNA-directed DNA polymerase from mobile element jockey [Stylophora pistillata]|uniref:RNA-directed DNA polymerase from mobile element jockey n=1 Tax=Stylophora pistillata TaxID=50429 RepID=A0A2B4RFL1_STYPI|nr:RNA-directed DNA polymerase from mobile element jockey [Stylophora pistillata]